MTAFELFVVNLIFPVRKFAPLCILDDIVLGMLDEGGV